MPINDNWYIINNIDEIDSPALVVYPERVRENISMLTSIIDDVHRLRPHVKTHKTKEAGLLMMQAGISKFKCATIAEAEMLASCGAPDILLAYQPIGPKASRLLALVKKYPSSIFSCLIDNIEAAHHLSKLFSENDLVLHVYIDVNVGMNRTGIQPGDAMQLFETIASLPYLKLMGLHAYDGHVRNADLAERKRNADEAFQKVSDLAENIRAITNQPLVIVAGGSPTFPIHAQRENAECSPGTFIFWDKGYSDLCPEQHFSTAALVITRVISLPDKSKLCLDLGHKSIAAENDISKRVYFLNAPQLIAISHSEEHMVVEAGEGHHFKTGDVLYGLPFHICPTVALYETACTVEDNRANGEWKITARNRMLEC